MANTPKRTSKPPDLLSFLNRGSNALSPLMNQPDFTKPLKYGKDPFAKFTSTVPLLTPEMQRVFHAAYAEAERQKAEQHKKNMARNAAAAKQNAAHAAWDLKHKQAQAARQKAAAAQRNAESARINAAHAAWDKKHKQAQAAREEKAAQQQRTVNEGLHPAAVGEHPNNPLDYKGVLSGRPQTQAEETAAWTTWALRTFFEYKKRAKTHADRARMNEIKQHLRNVGVDAEQEWIRATQFKGKPAPKGAADTKASGGNQSAFTGLNNLTPTMAGIPELASAAGVPVVGGIPVVTLPEEPDINAMMTQLASQPDPLTVADWARARAHNPKDPRKMPVPTPAEYVQAQQDSAKVNAQIAHLGAVVDTDTSLIGRIGQGVIGVNPDTVDVNAQVQRMAAVPVLRNNPYYAPAVQQEMQNVLDEANRTGVIPELGASTGFWSDVRSDLRFGAQGAGKGVLNTLSFGAAEPFMNWRGDPRSKGIAYLGTTLPLTMLEFGAVGKLGSIALNSTRRGAALLKKLAAFDAAMGRAPLLKQLPYQMLKRGTESTVANLPFQAGAAIGSYQPGDKIGDLAKRFGQNVVRTTPGAFAIGAGGGAAGTVLPRMIPENPLVQRLAGMGMGVGTMYGWHLVGGGTPESLPSTLALGLLSGRPIERNLGPGAHGDRVLVNGRRGMFIDTVEHTDGRSYTGVLFDGELQPQLVPANAVRVVSKAAPARAEESIRVEVQTKKGVKQGEYLELVEGDDGRSQAKVHLDGETAPRLVNPEHVRMASEPVRPEKADRPTEGYRAEKLLAELDRALAAGQTDPRTHALARMMIERDPTITDATISLVISDMVRKATPEILKAEGIAPQAEDYYIVGHTTSHFTEGLAHATIGLLRGHTPEAAVEEFMHRGWDLLSHPDSPLYDREAAIAYQRYYQERVAAGEKRALPELFAQEARDAFFTHRLHEHTGPVRRLFVTIGQVLRNMVNRIRINRNLQQQGIIPRHIDALYQRVGRGQLQRPDVNGSGRQAIDSSMKPLYNANRRLVPWAETTRKPVLPWSQGKVLAQLPLPGGLLPLENYAVRRVQVEVAPNVYKDVPIRNSELAGKVHPVSKVPFDLDGYPIFKSIIEVKIKFTGNRQQDIQDAIKVAREKGLVIPKGKKFVWHHHQDGETMQLVNRRIHRITGHTGGFALHPII